MVAGSKDSARVLQVGADGVLVRAAVDEFEEGGAVDVADSTDDALTHLTERYYDCVVLLETDRAEPVPATLASIREQEPALPVVVVTSDTTVASDALEAGAADVLVRLADLDQPPVLARRIANVLGAHGRERAMKDGPDEADQRAPVGYPADQETELEQLRTVIEALPNEVYMLDTDGNFRSIIPATDSEKTLSGYDPEALIGEHVTSVLAGDDFEAGQAAVRELITDEETERVSFDAALRTESGEEIPHEVHIASLHEGDGDRVTGTVGILYDVSERKERERRLREERDFVELTLDTIDDAFYLLDEHGNLERWNETMRVVTGYSDEELASMNALDFFEGDDRERVADAVARTLETGTARVEAEFVRKDGNAIPFEFTGAKLTDRDGTLRGLVGIGRDVAGRKEREEKLRQIRENASDVIWMTTPEKDAMTFVSEAYEDIWGRSTESLMTDPDSFVEAIHPDDRERVEAALTTQRTDPDEYDETYRVVQPDGEVRWVHDRASGVHDDDGELNRIVGIATDVTERKERERELEQAETIFETAHEAIFLYEYTDDGTFRLNRANPAYESLVGRPLEEVRGKTPTEIFGPEIGASIASRHRACVESKEPVVVEETLDVPEGPVTLLSNLAPVVVDGSVEYTVGAIRDITERKQRERELELKNRAMDEAPIGITIHDASDPDARITYANDGLSDLTGYDVDALGDDWLSVLTGPETALKRVAQLERGMERQEAVKTVVLFYRADGTPFWSRISLAPVEHDGEVTHFVGFQQDVTESKEHEQEIERRLDEFSDVLAQELHAPIREARRELESARDNGSQPAVTSADQWLQQLDGLIDDLATVHSFSVKSRETADAMNSDDGDDQ